MDDRTEVEGVIDWDSLVDDHSSPSLSSPIPSSITGDPRSPTPSPPSSPLAFCLALRLLRRRATRIIRSSLSGEWESSTSFLSSSSASPVASSPQASPSSPSSPSTSSLMRTKWSARQVSTASSCCSCTRT